MLLLGNDIVNLSVERALNKHLEQRFLQRILTLKEKELVLNSKQQHKTLWAIWAAKEACFKACQKQELGLIFSHKKFIIDLALHDVNKNNKNVFGIGRHGNNLLSIKWYFNDNTIHAMAVLLGNNQFFSSWDNIKSSIFPIDSTNYTNESLSTRIQAKKFLSSPTIRSYFSSISTNLFNVEIIRQKSIINSKLKILPPKVVSKDQKGLNKVLNIEISLSHDHGWGAVALAKSDLITIRF